ncbi:PhoH family protein [Candidatus Uabimicrobium sp. HlEnr_7]|uniref:PhoH family protein n=1 Tax=Candidatus Uabimicrobium helgolandensis TaxID=3095367 RepID=UPI003557F97A
MEHTISLNDFPDISLLFGAQNCNIKLMKKKFNVDILARDHLKILGDAHSIECITRVVEQVKAKILKKGNISQKEVNMIIEKHLSKETETKTETESQEEKEYFPISPRTLGQKNYLLAMKKNDIVFAIGPAGTGKTHLAVAMALDALHKNTVRKLILVRPAVEAGEKLGFLPGDFQAKVNPYLRPLYDSLYDLGGYDRVKKYMEKSIIEVAPLAYMRGRTLENAFIILDEAQNTTGGQMRMFLTRMGLHSKTVVTGDQTQVDLPPGQISGLVEAGKILRGVRGIEFAHLTQNDIVRHRLVQRIVEAYEKKSQNSHNQ